MKKHEEKKQASFFDLVLAFFVIIFIIYLIYNIFFRKTYDTVVAEKELYIDTFDAEGMILFNQVIYDTGSDADILVEDGERVSKGEGLFHKGLKESKELNELNLLISQQEGLGKDAYFEWTDGLREIILKEDYGALGLYSVAEFKNSDIYFNNIKFRMETDDIEALKQKRDILEEERKKIEGFATVYSDIAGVVSLKGSKLYPSININDKEAISLKTFDIEPKTQGDLRVVDNFEALIVLKIKAKELDEMPEIGYNFRVMMDEMEIRGVIESVKSEGDYYILSMNIRDELHRLIEHERDTFKVIRFKEEVFKVPIEAIIRDGSKTGVFIDYKGGIVRYVPIDIVREKEGYVYLSIGDKDSKIKDPITKEMVGTIEQYDEILLHPENLKENDILDRN